MTGEGAGGQGQGWHLGCFNVLLVCSSQTERERSRTHPNGRSVGSGNGRKDGVARLGLRAGESTAKSESTNYDTVISN